MKKVLLMLALVVAGWMVPTSSHAQVLIAPGPVFVPAPVYVPVPVYAPQPVFFPPTTFTYTNYATPYGVMGTRTVATPYGAYATRYSYATPFIPNRFGYNYGVWARPGRVIIVP